MGMVSVEIPDGGFPPQRREICTNLCPRKHFGGVSQPVFPQTCARNLGGCINDLVLTKLNKQQTLSGEYWRKPEQDTSDLIWVKVNE